MHIYIHIYSQFSAAVGSRARNDLRKWFLLELLSYRGCCKSPTGAIQSHGGAVGTEGWGRQRNNASLAHKQRLLGDQRGQSEWPVPLSFSRHQQSPI